MNLTAETNGIIPEAPDKPEVAESFEYGCECVDVGPKLTDKEWLEKLDGVAFAGRVVEVVEVEESERGFLP